MAFVIRVLGYSQVWSECHSLRGASLGLSALVSRGVPVEQTRGMAGHSKWANIRHTKGLKDTARSKSFAKITSLMRVAIMEGGNTNPKLNSKLARVIQFAQSNNVPAVTITNFLQNYQKSKDSAQLHVVELQGTGGVCLLVEVLTSNFTRTRDTIKAVVKKTYLREARGSVRYLFDEKGIVVTEKCTSLESALDTAITLGAEDVVEEEDCLVFTCSPGDMLRVRQGLEKLHYSITYANVDFLPKHPTTVSEEDQSHLSIIVQKLEVIDEVMKVHLNL